MDKIENKFREDRAIRDNAQGHAEDFRIPGALTFFLLFSILFSYFYLGVKKI